MTESCYWCGFIEPESTESMSVTGFCVKHQKRVDLEDESCVDFKLYPSLKRMMKESQPR